MAFTRAQMRYIRSGGNYGRRMRSNQKAQGGTRAQYSATTSFIRHATTQTFDLATGKCVAIPLICYNTSAKRGTVTANPLGSSKNQSPYVTMGSRVDNISINLHKNDKVALVGKNGVGKSNIIEVHNRPKYLESLMAFIA